jgi:hypothetical protein
MPASIEDFGNLGADHRGVFGGFENGAVARHQGGHGHAGGNGHGEVPGGNHHRDAVGK